VPWLRLGLLHSVLLTGDGTFSMELNTCADLQTTGHAMPQLSGPMYTAHIWLRHGLEGACTVMLCMQCVVMTNSLQCLLLTSHTKTAAFGEC
jgi:hypothetical protein